MEPKLYDLSLPEERARLFAELYGYIRVSRQNGLKKAKQLQARLYEVKTRGMAATCPESEVYGKVHARVGRLDSHNARLALLRISAEKLKEARAKHMDGADTEGRRYAFGALIEAIWEGLGAVEPGED